MKNTISKIFFGLFCCQIFLTASFAQETFDVVTYTPPKGWQKSAETKAIQFTKQNGNQVAIMMLFKSIPTAKDSKTTFDTSWDSIVKELLTKVDSPNMQPSVEKNGWTIETGAALGEKDGEKLVAMLLSATGGGKVLNLLVLFNSEAFQTEVESFISSIDLPKVMQTSGNNNSTQQSPNSFANSALTGKIWEGTVDEKFVGSGTMTGYKTGGFSIKQYQFNADGTYRFVSVLASHYTATKTLEYETGTYSVSGSQLTINPTKGQNEEWSKTGKTSNGNSDVGNRAINETWDKKLKTTDRKLEKYTYTFNIGKNGDKNALIMQRSSRTERDGEGSVSYLNETTPQNSVKLPRGY